MGVHFRCRIRLASFAMLFVWTSIGCRSLHAEPSIPWLPDAFVRHDIELLVDEAQLDLIVTQWPLPRAAVRHALAKLPAALPAALQMARDRVERSLALDLASRLTLTLRDRDDALTGYGDDATRGSSIAVRSAALSDSLLAARVGLRVDTLSGLQETTKLRFDDSALVTELLGVQLQAFSHRQWWGPGWQSSLVLSNNAPAFNGIGLQRASASRSESPWLAWLGPWNYDMFIAQTEDVSTPANPYFFAQRLTFKPWSNLELAITRTAQWGGRGRQQTARSFLNMLTGKGTNADTIAQEGADPANQESGFDARLRCPGGLRCATYLQLIGEDEGGHLPSRYLGLYGVESWSSDGSQRYFAEYAETGCRSPIGRPFLRDCAYRNYAYPQGYTNAGRWIGASVGPDSRLLTLGWADAALGTSIKLSAGGVGSRIGSFTPDVIDPATSGHVFAISAKQVLAWGSATITPEIDWVHVAAANGSNNQARVGATFTLGLDSAFASGSNALGASLASGDASGLKPLWIGAGLVAAATLLDRSADDYAKAHAQNPSGRALGHIGNAVPVGAFGLAGLSWALQSGTVQGDVALAALEAGVTAGAIAEVGKYAIDRSRPNADHGSARFGSGPRTDASFPSAHAAVAWAVLTPYAKYYDAPWLYGLAALTNAGKVASREHWLSDTVAGAAMGYYLGDLFYRRSKAADDSGVRVWVTPRSVWFQKSFD